MSKRIKNIDRREFLTMVGGGAAAVALPGCKPKASNNTTSTANEPVGEMEYRISNNGDKVSLLGYGCNRWPVLDKPEPDGFIIDQKASNELIDYAIERGVNFFDTAPPYSRGFSERVMGDALSRHPRDKYFISTKLSNFSAKTQTREGAIELYKKSMELLKVDYIDYYLLHSVGGAGVTGFNKRFIDNGMLDYFTEERAAGRIRNFGFSYHGDKETFDYVLSLHDNNTVKWDCALIMLNYKDWNYADETSAKNVDASYLYAELERRGIDAIIMEPILGGRLATLPAYLDNMLKAERPTASTASWGFRFAGTPPKVITVLSGMTKFEFIDENVKTYSPLEKISTEENDLLMDIATKMIELPIVECSNCQYCMPCPYGLDIPGIFTHFNKCIFEGQYPQSVQDENFKEARRAFLIGYDRAVPKLRQADHCIGCRECVKHCPPKIDIPKQMRRINAYVEALKQGDLDGANNDEFMMKIITERLEAENASCVIANGSDVRSFSKSGVADLYELVKSEPDFLRGALVADKIVGKGAAALMIYGGVKRMHTKVLSKGAEDFIFNESRMIMEYDQITPFIENRSKTGWCPLESRCKDETDVDKLIVIIDKFIQDLKDGNVEGITPAR